MDIGDIHDFIALLENHEAGAYHSPSQIDDAVDRASKDLFWQFAPVVGTSKEAKTALDPFTQKYYVTPINSPGGLVTLPSNQRFPSILNFAALLAASVISYDNKLLRTVTFDIDMVNADEKSQRLNSQIKPVTIDRPIAESLSNGVYQLYPQLPNTCEFTYLALPVKPRYGYTQPGRKPIYDPSASTQLQWNESYYTKIMDKALVYLGLNLGDMTFTQFMQQKAAS